MDEYILCLYAAFVIKYTKSYHIYQCLTCSISYKFSFLENLVSHLIASKFIAYERNWCYRANKKPYRPQIYQWEQWIIFTLIHRRWLDGFIWETGVHAGWSKETGFCPITNILPIWKLLKPGVVQNDVDKMNIYAYIFMLLQSILFYWFFI